jgi:hypothetical protein
MDGINMDEQQTEQIKRDIEQLKKDIQELKVSGDIPYDTEKALRERLGDIQPTVAIADADVTTTTTLTDTVSITIPDGGGTDTYALSLDVDHLSFPDGWIQIKVNGAIRKLPYYNA